MPVATAVAMGGMLFVAVGVVVRLVRSLIPVSIEVPLAIVILVTAMVSIMFSFIPFLSAWAVWRGWKSGRVLVTIVSAVALLSSLTFADVLHVVIGAAAIAAGIAIHLPPARVYEVDIRASGK